MAAMDVDVVAGPDTGRRFRLGAGRYVFGRAGAATVRLRDPAVEAHHAVLDVGADGRMRLTRLAGRLPLVVDGHAHPDGPVDPGALVAIGSSLLALGRPTSTATGSGHARRAAAERARYLARGRAPWTVVVGYGPVVLPIATAPGRWSLSAEAALANAERHAALPVFCDLAARSHLVLGVRGGVARQVLAALVDQLPRPDTSGRRWVVRGEVPRRPSGGAPLTVLVALAAAADAVGCDALLDVGDHWRGSFLADTRVGATRPVHVVGRPEPIADTAAG